MYLWKSGISLRQASKKTKLHRNRLMKFGIGSHTRARDWWPIGTHSGLLQMSSDRTLKGCYDQLELILQLSSDVATNKHTGCLFVCRHICACVSVSSSCVRSLSITYIDSLKREIDHRLATHFHPAALSAQIAEVGQTEGRSQAKLLLKCVAVVGAA